MLTFPRGFSLRFILFLYVYISTSVLSHVKQHWTPCTFVIFCTFYSFGIFLNEYHLWINWKITTNLKKPPEVTRKPTHILFVFYGSCSLRLSCFQDCWQCTQSVLSLSSHTVLTQTLSLSLTIDLIYQVLIQNHLFLMFWGIQKINF